MNRPATRRRPRALLAACLFAAGCAGASHAPRSNLQEKIGTPGGLSAEELRLRLYEMPELLAGRIEATADGIAAESSDPSVRRRALLWKADGVPALYTAALRPDPLVGALDLWVLLYQMQDYFDGGAGKDAFGPQQPRAVAATRRMVALMETTAEPLYVDHALYEKRRAEVQEFARSHPIDGTFSSRETSLSLLARLASADSGGTLAAVGQATDTLAEMSLRLNAYVTLLPRLVRWQAELAAEDVTGRENLADTLDDVRTIARAADRAHALLSDVPGAVREASGPLKELIDQQRTVLLAEIDRERDSMTAFITAERQAAMASVSEERRAAMASVGQERAAALAGIDELTRRSIEDASRRARSMADVVFWRVLLLIAAAAVLFAVAYRFARGGFRPAK